MEVEYKDREDWEEKWELWKPRVWFCMCEVCDAIKHRSGGVEQEVEQMNLHLKGEELQLQI